MPRHGLLLPAAAILWLAVGATAQERPTQTPVRFHHVHYAVAEPASAMNAIARELQAVRVVVPGLGVGVRTGREYVLFDRAGEQAPGGQERPVAERFNAAVSWLAARNVSVEPARYSDLEVAQAAPQGQVDHLAFSTGDLDGTAAALRHAGAVVLRRSEDAVLFDAGNGSAIEIVRETDRVETHWCPMHPDVRSADAGACPLCGMALVPIPPPKIGEYRLDVTQLRPRGRFAGLTFAVREPDSNALVTRFAVVHEKPFHLFVVSRDLEYFAHVHPELMPDGRLTLTHPLPGGEYMLIADFLPEGGTSQMIQKAILVGGPRGTKPRADDSNGLAVRLDTADLAPGKHARLTFTVSDARTGTPVTNLEPYLGAPAHMLLVRSDLGDAVHAHPEEIRSGGPTVTFHPVIPAAGEYRLWIQFQRGGKVSTATFAFTVER